MMRRIFVALGVVGAVTGSAVFGLSAPAAAHNCGSLIDCLPSGKSLLTALAAVLIIGGLAVILIGGAPLFFGGGLALATGGVIGGAGAISLTTIGAGAISVGTGIALANVAQGMPSGGGSSQSSSQSSSSRASSEKLGENLEQAGHVRPPDSAAHHLVAGESRLAGSARSVLQRFGIDINAAENGAFLPRNLSATNPGGSAVHSTLHTNRYYAEVNRLLGQATSRQEVIDTLSFIRSKLLAGPWP